MFEGLLTGLFTAWVLSWFGVDKIVVDVIQSFLHNPEITVSHYYVLFGLIGMIGGAFNGGSSGNRKG
jgi:hypothetical protein